MPPVGSGEGNRGRAGGAKSQPGRKHGMSLAARRAYEQGPPRRGGSKAPGKVPRPPTSPAASSAGGNSFGVVERAPSVRPSPRVGRGVVAIGGGPMTGGGAGTAVGGQTPSPNSSLYY